MHRAIGWLVVCFLAILTGCKSMADPDTVGEGEWVRDTCRPFEALNAMHGIESFWVEKATESTYKITLKPAQVTNIPPPYPGSKLLDSTNMLISETRVYSIPEGRSFVDVWEYYQDWFHFGRRNPQPGLTPPPGSEMQPPPQQK